MTVAEMLVKCLETEGVTRIFGVPGEENQDFLFAVDASEKIEFIPTRHEQGAAFIANVIGRLTGKAGVCLATLGPGATNLLTGIADANSDKSPVIALTGQGSLERLHHESHQAIDVVRMFEPVTKWNTSIIDPEITAEVVRKAFKLAEAEKPGVCHIELPENIAALEVPSVCTPMQPRLVMRPAPESSAVEKAAQLLLKAEKPLVIAGNGAIRNRSSKVLTEFAEKLNLPVVHTFEGKGAVSDRSEQSLFAIGLGFKDYVAEAIEEADLIITIGYDIAEYSPDAWNSSSDKDIIHIDFAPAEVYHTYNPLVEAVGDIALSVKALQEATTGKSRCENWFADIRNRIADDIKGYDLKAGEDFNVPGILNEIRKVMSDDGLLISDVGAHKMWIARNFKTYEPNGCIISNGLASMGISLPGGIGASIVNPDREIVSFMGDGGFMMNVQELETAKRLGVGYTIIVTVDDNYGLITWKQERHTGDSTGTKLGNPDFVKLAEAFGIPGYRPKNLKDLRSILQKTIPSKELCLIAIPISTKVNDELTKKLKEYYEKAEGEE